MHSLYLSSEMRKSTQLRSYTCVFPFLHAVLWERCDFWEKGHERRKLRDVQFLEITEVKWLSQAAMALEWFRLQIILFKIFSVCVRARVCAFVQACAYHNMHVELRGHLLVSVFALHSVWDNISCCVLLSTGDLMACVSIWGSLVLSSHLNTEAGITGDCYDSGCTETLGTLTQAHLQGKHLTHWASTQPKLTDILRKSKAVYTNL